MVTHLLCLLLLRQLNPTNTCCYFVTWLLTFNQSWKLFQSSFSWRECSIWWNKTIFAVETHIETYLFPIASESTCIDGYGFTSVSTAFITVRKQESVLFFAIFWVSTTYWGLQHSQSLLCILFHHVNFSVFMEVLVFATERGTCGSLLDLLHV